MFCDDTRAPSSGISGSRDGSSGDFAGASDNASASGLELEPLVERVASALEQRCGVRGGDLVRLGAHVLYLPTLFLWLPFSEEYAGLV